MRLSIFNSSTGVSLSTVLCPPPPLGGGKRAKVPILLFSGAVLPPLPPLGGREREEAYSLPFGKLFNRIRRLDTPLREWRAETHRLSLAADCLRGWVTQTLL